MNLQPAIARYYTARANVDVLDSYRVDCERAARDMSGTDDAHVRASARASEAKTAHEEARRSALVLADNLIDAMVAREQKRAA